MLGRTVVSKGDDTALSTTEKLVERHCLSMRHRFDDLAVYEQHLASTAHEVFRANDDDQSTSKVTVLRKRLDALQHVPVMPQNEVLPLALASIQ